MSDLRLIVGLGNPGTEYEYTRHNLGFLVLIQLAKQHHLKITSSKLCKGMVAEGEIASKACCLLFPLTYMNNSGRAVKPFVQQNEVAFENVLVVCDDLNLDFGQIRVRRRGSDGGHNGLSSIIEKLGSESFARLRLGIGPGPNDASSAKQKDVVDFVLEEFSADEKKVLDDFIQQAVDCCVAWVKDDIEKVMNQFNQRQ